MEKYMCRFIEIGVVCLGVLVMGESCRESVPVGEPSRETDVVRFTLDSPSLADYSSRGSSRAMTETVENEVATADVLVFESAPDGNGTLLSRRGAELVSGTTFEVELPRGTYDLMVVGNVADMSAVVPRSSKEEAIGRLTLSQPGKWNYDDPIPMWGHTDGVAVDAATMLRVDMHRMLVRVDVLLAAAVTNFEMREIWLANTNTAGQVAPDYLDPAVWDPTGGVVNPGKGVAIAPSLPADPEKQGGPAQMFTSADGVQARSAVRTIYTFEAANGTDQTRSENPCIIIGGSYDGAIRTTYYRVDFAVTENGALKYLPLLRNHNYVITIRSVSGPGMSTPQDAFESVGSDIEIGLQEWQDGGIGPVEL